MATRDSKTFTFEDLDVYKVGLDLAESIYRLTLEFPAEEKFGLVSQMRRASVSVPANIAEGWGRGKGAANAQFVKISRGSVYELTAMLTLAERLGFAKSTTIVETRDLLSRTGRLVQAYLASIESSNVVREEVALYNPNYESPVTNHE